MDSVIHKELTSHFTDLLITDFIFPTSISRLGEVVLYGRVFFMTGLVPMDGETIQKTKDNLNYYTLGNAAHESELL